MMGLVVVLNLLWCGTRRIGEPDFDVARLALLRNGVGVSGLVLLVEGLEFGLAGVNGLRNVVQRDRKSVV